MSTRSLEYVGSGGAKARRLTTEPQPILLVRAGTDVELVVVGEDLVP